MPDSTLVEGIKLFGGIAGLGTAVFTLWDRMIRSRPVVNLSANLPVGLGVNPKILVKIRNPGSIDIIVEEIESSDPHVYIASDDTVTSLLQASAGIRNIAVVPAGGERSFMIMEAQIDDESINDFSLTIRWRPITAYYFSRPPLVVRVKAGVLQSLEDEAKARYRAAYEERR